jgi:hypothetical protein
MADYTISIQPDGKLNPDPVKCHINDTITWTNNLTVDDSLTLPACVKPQDGPVPIGSGQSSKKYAVFEKGKYNYRHEWRKKPHVVDATAGTIDVG